MAIVLESLSKQLSQHLKNDPDGFIRGLVASIDPKALVAFSKSINKAICGIAEWAAKIDWAAIRDGRWLRHIVLQAAKDAMERDDLSEHDRENLSEDTEEFKFCVDRIISSPDGKCDKLAAFGAIEHAFMIAGRSRISKETLDKITRERTAAANQARRADDVQTIIESLAKDLWFRKPSYSNNLEGTAKEIRQAVNQEIVKLTKIPNGWQPSDSNDKASIKKEVDRIRKRIERIANPDNCHSSA